MSNSKQILLRNVKAGAIYTDANTGASLNCAIYMPKFPEDAEDWKFFGYAVRRLPDGYNYLGDPSVINAGKGLHMVIGTELTEGLDPNAPGAFCEAQRGKVLWSANHAGGTQNLIIYEAKPVHPDYRALGVWVWVDGTDVQLYNNHSKLVCVHKDLLSPGRLSTTRNYSSQSGPGWDDSGSGAHDTGGWPDVSFWNVKAGPDRGVAPQTFVAARYYDLANSSKPGGTTPEPLVIKRGVYRYHGFRSRWMHTAWRLDNYDRELTEYCLPATHDTGTYSLIDEFAEDKSQKYMNAFGAVMNELKDLKEDAKQLGIENLVAGTSARRRILSEVIATATAQTRTITGQLTDGIRGLDLRVYYDAKDDMFRVGHGLLGCSMFEMFSEIEEFLDACQGEILHISMGHWTGFEHPKLYEKFLAGVFEVFMNKLLTPPQAKAINGRDNDLTGLAYKTLTNNGTQSRVILTWSMPEPGDPNKDVYTRAQSAFLNKRANLPFPSNPTQLTYRDFIKLYLWDYRCAPPNSPLPHMTHKAYAAFKPTIYGAYTESTDVSKVFSQQVKWAHDCAGDPETQDIPFAFYGTLTPGQADTIIRVANAGVSGEIARELERKLKEQLTNNPDNYATQPWDSLHELAGRINPDVMQHVREATSWKPPFLVYVDDYETVPDFVNQCMNISRRL